MDETSKQLVAATCTPLPATPGQPQRIDYGDERRGTANLFMIFAPLAEERHVKVTARRTAVDCAERLRDVVDAHYPQAEKIGQVMDNLNTHTPVSLYEAFPPAEVRRLLERLEIHDTSKHGSWLNMAGSELSVFQQQCLDRRIPDTDTLTREIAVWEHQRNLEHATIDWRFSVSDAQETRTTLSITPIVIGY